MIVITSKQFDVVYEGTLRGEIDTMSEIIKKRASESIGKEVKIFLLNGWRYAGKLTNSDEQYLEILDTVSSSYKIINISEIKDMEISE